MICIKAESFRLHKVSVIFPVGIFEEITNKKKCSKWSGCHVHYFDCFLSFYNLL